MNTASNQHFEDLPDRTEIFTKDQDGPLAFTIQNGDHSLKQHRLELRGQPLYETGYGCNTCRAMFGSGEPINTPLTPEELSARFAGELTKVTSDIIATVLPLLPRGQYLVGLLRANPQFEEFYPPTSSISYQWLCRKSIRDCVTGLTWFKGRQIPSFGPRTESEVILPHRIRGSYDSERIWKYRRHSEVWMYTILALSITEWRDWSGKYSENRLTHFLLDGHHKTMAASEAGQPIQILSFLNLTMSEIPIWDMTIRKADEYQTHRPTNWLYSGESWSSDTGLD